MKLVAPLARYPFSVAVLLSPGSIDLEVAAVLFDDEGRLSALDEDGTAGAVSFDLLAMRDIDLNRLRVRPLIGESLELVHLYGDGEIERVAAVATDEFVRVYSDPSGAWLLVADEGQEHDVSLLVPGHGWRVSSAMPERYGSVVAASSTLLERLYGRGTLLPPLPPLGPRSRPSGLSAEEAVPPLPA
jgi:hypothetical protein